MNATSAGGSFGFRPEHVVEMFLRGYGGTVFRFTLPLAEVDDG